MESARVPDRFRIVRQLGAGAMGVVYEVEDRERGEHVALKALEQPSPELVYRLKREFRALAGIRHPNLITLHELIASKRGCIFTMELVDGVELRSYVAGEPGFNEARLREALAQLATGLAALHLLGKVHRDIKPANVLVTSEHRVVLVDFGLATSTASSDEHTPHPLLGTAAYVAPEQAVGGEPSAAADWYSVGIMLYEILAGRLPFRGAPLDVLAAKQRSAPPPPSSVAGPLPPDLDQLCVDLLSPRPGDRPSDAEILRRLGLDPDDERIEAETTDYAEAVAIPFAGRDAELARVLELARQPRPTAVLVAGPSGIGKSALARAAIEALRDRAPDAMCLRGRCYERETVPYKALDSVIDELSRFWRELEPERAIALVPAHAESLRRLFPVLGRVPALLRGAVGQPPVDPNALRTHGLAGLRAVLRAIAADRPVVLYVDDMQWVDGDTVLLLDDLFRGPEPLPITLLFTARRTDGVLGELVRRLDERDVRIEQLDLAPLPLEAARALAAAHIGSRDPELVARVAAEAEGNPFYIGELARQAQQSGGALPSLADALAARIEALAPPSRRVVELLAVAAEPVSIRALRSATGLARAELPRVVRELAEAHLVRASGPRSTDVVEAYHDRVRATALGLIPVERRAIHHRELAVALEGWAEGNAERLARHWFEAGDVARATVHARQAADHAMATMDSDRAAGLYRMALALGTANGEERLSLRTSLGEALSSGGRVREAAEAFLATLADAPPERHSEIRRRSAEELMRGGHLREGLEAIQPVLDEHGIRLPSSVPGALASLLARRATGRLRGLRWRPRPVTARELERIDILRAVATGTNLSDLVRGAECQSRHLAAALRCDDPLRVTRALTYECGHVAAIGSPRARRAAAEAARIAEREGDQLLEAFAEWSRGVVGYYLDNQWSASLSWFEDAKKGFLHYTSAGWELDMTHVFMSFDLLYRGDLPRLAEEVPILVQQAERRGDRYDAVNMRTRMNIIWLVEDRPEVAEREVTHAIERDMPSSERYLAQHFFALFARAELALYRDEPAAARAAIESELDRLRRSLLLKIRMCDLELVHLRGRVEVALAARAAERERREHLVSARAHARRLAGFREPVAAQLAAALEAGIAAVAGEDADALLAGAIESLDAGGTGLYAAAARLCSADAAVAAQGRQWMQRAGVVDPDRLARMLVPGF